MIKQQTVSNDSQNTDVIQALIRNNFETVDRNSVNCVENVTNANVSVACDVETIDKLYNIHHPIENSSNILSNNIIRIKKDSVTVNDTLESSLRDWVKECKPKISHVNKLLGKLLKFPLGIGLPKTYETLLS